MSYEESIKKLTFEKDVEHSTMMKTPCLRYKGEFMGMFFDKEDALIVKLSPYRVNEIIEQGFGREFNFTKKRFKEWVLIPTDFEELFESYFYEALKYAKTKEKDK